MSKPIIGITGPSGGGRNAWLWTRLAVIRAGARPVRITPARSTNLPPLDGLVIGGGVHVGMLTHPSQGRDELEIELATAALASELPTLGICRGAQVMNVALGGTLQRDLGTHMKTIMPRKAVHVRVPSRLADLLGRGGEHYVNALHDHAVDQLGKDLIASATDDSGYVQAIELPEHPLFVGVQWHPEYLPHTRAQSRLFRGLVEAAHARAARSAV